MLNRFKPIILFSSATADFRSCLVTIKGFYDANQRSRAKGWKVFVEHYEDIALKAEWAFYSVQSILQHFPTTKEGKYCASRHLLIKEYEKGKDSSGQSLASRGFEGSNFRLVMASDKDRNISCQFGEYLNLSGSVLEFRERYPEVTICECCGKQPAVTICIICGKCFCKKCGTLCKKCRHMFCRNCSSPWGVLGYSEHEWYYHKNSK